MVSFKKQVSAAYYPALCTMRCSIPPNPFKNDDFSEEKIDKSINFLLNYDPPTEIDSHGTKFWKNSLGELHRDNGPAVIYKNGTKAWYQNDKLHRLYEPAIINYNGRKEWYQNGKRHRENGPAIIYPDGTKIWYQNGEEYSEEDYN